METTYHELKEQLNDIIDLMDRFVSNISDTEHTSPLHQRFMKHINRQANDIAGELDALHNRFEQFELDALDYWENKPRFLGGGLRWTA